MPYLGLSANTPQNSKIGVLNLKCNNQILYSLDIILVNDLTRTSWKDYIKIFFENYKNYFNLYV